MKQIKVNQYDAFSRKPHKGNPAGVVFHADSLTDHEMQLVATKAKFSETAFILPSSSADLHIRYFTPGQEVDLCGHATIASIYALYTNNMLSKRELTIETKAGILPIKIEDNDQVLITMTQAKPIFQPFKGSKDELAGALGITVHDFASDLPIVYGSTGSWTLIVPLKSLNACQKMQPLSEKFPQILTDFPRASIHPFCFETIHKAAHMHGRHFSSPYSGIVEDPVTGTASGVMGAYYATYVNDSAFSSMNLLVEQGLEIERDGLVYVKIENSSELCVSIAGEAVYVETKTILI
ncbi:PhzF family phenazine biosynthesis protein [Priestia flexa]|uniref:PhzF family phenazine biosynthesis protein n=1 Tax=Priestia flexa TaxID=86664 RepID=UPI002892580D|nr:PhzF family phenazine biosynthesis protein [Priestia flexa]MDT2047087.1 PhzF family phenazine biosynthesis protein [Priestia flexa]